MPKPVTLVSLSISPRAYMPMLANIMGKYECQHQLQKQSAQESQQQELSRLFSLWPVPSLSWVLISINSNVLLCFSGIKMPTNYEIKSEVFSKVFDCKRLRLDRKVWSYIPDSFLTNMYVASRIYKSQTKRKNLHSQIWSELTISQQMWWLKNVTSTDDYTYYSDQDVDISVLGDVMKNEDLNDISLCAIDPNRNQVFVAFYGEGSH